MFGWFRRRCPLDTWDQTWVEWRMRWLIDQFGLESLRRVRVVEPTAEFFPDEWRGTPDQVHTLFAKVCDWMLADPSHLELRLVLNSEINARGIYRREGNTAIISIASSQMCDFESLIAAMAHEVAHDRLLGESRVDGNEGDHEWLTDLLPVYFGLGIFAANNVLREANARQGNLSWWTMERRGYLPAHLFGYAFGVFAWMRSEDNPQWMRWLRLDAVETMRKGLKFLNGSEKSILCFPIREAQSLRVLRDQLTAREASLRLAALWEAATLGPEAAELVSLIVDRLNDKDATIRSMALTALAKIGEAAKSAAMEIVPCLRDDDPKVRKSAAIAIRDLLPNADDVLPELWELLADDDVDVLYATVRAIRAYGPDGEIPLKPGLQTFMWAQNKCEFELLDELAGILSSLPNLPQKIRECYLDWDESRCDELACDILGRVESHPETTNQPS